MNRSVSMVATVALVFAMGCKKKVIEPPPDRTPVQSVEVRLQISSVSPSQVDANKAIPGKVYGGGFEAGANVKFGDRAAGSATVVDPNTIDVEIPGLPPGSYDVVVTNPGGQSTTLRQGLTSRSDAAPDCAFTRVFFDFDSSAIRSDSRATLNGNVACYQRLTGQIRIAGHADERGTTDYNLALGERRANAVRSHLTSQGISTGRISTVSFGEEQPLERGSNEAAWSKNRRAEINAN